MARLGWTELRQGLAYADEKNASLISAGVAFYALFAIFPGIAATISLFGLLADPEVVEGQLELMRDFIPPGAFGLFAAQIDRLLGAGGQTLGWTTGLSIGVALWSARAGVAALMRGLNAIFGRPNRGGLGHVLVALMLTAALVGIAIVALLLVVVTPILLQFLPFIGGWAWLLEILRWAVAIAVLVLGLGLLYRYGPNMARERLAWFTPGAGVVVVCWFAMSALFSTYVANFSNYNEVYGSIGAVIALLMWFYLSSYLVLVGAALNMALRRYRGADSSSELSPE
ncbi:MAG: YihY/virulence factor BrkB family protein [Salibaculum sp.]|uniref:YihY/virulence factor BrkB family protein n=1 Tax=Salibaculum sp. TaxID=2855480 RepID=UPI00286FBE5D|nr:YihY/virulence factor BrkB family protein [Salibaculum sp.]MDR9427919.1 YihY/virulence factor BrkB family protein [Salibaculum sp.]MDR9483403.1 YihY/virulence factor BrkB family protein [Salibaculum sp.]